MDLTQTLAAAAVAALIALACGWLGARPPDPRRGPRLVPYRFLMLLAAAATLFLLAHVANLFGVTTGR